MERIDLKPGGRLIYADQVQGATTALDELYKSDWKRKVEASDLTVEQIQSAYERTKLDRFATLDSQLGWMREIGFQDVDCVYKCYNFVVLYGVKPA